MTTPSSPAGPRPGGGSVGNRRVAVALTFDGVWFAQMGEIADDFRARQAADAPGGLPP